MRFSVEPWNRGWEAPRDFPWIFSLPKKRGVGVWVSHVLVEYVHDMERTLLCWNDFLQLGESGTLGTHQNFILKLLQLLIEIDNFECFNK